MKLAIVGSRTFNNYCLLQNTVLMCFREYIALQGLSIISGGANGADSLAKKFAIDYKLRFSEYLAEWNKYGKSAGFLRNQTIVDNCDMVLAFWNGESRGTADTIEKAKKAKKPTFIIYF